MRGAGTCPIARLPPFQARQHNETNGGRKRPKNVPHKANERDAATKKKNSGKKKWRENGAAQKARTQRRCATDHCRATVRWASVLSPVCLSSKVFPTKEFSVGGKIARAGKMRGRGLRRRTGWRHCIGRSDVGAFFIQPDDCATKSMAGIELVLRRVWLFGVYRMQKRMKLKFNVFLFNKLYLSFPRVFYFVDWFFFSLMYVYFFISIIFIE